MSIENDKKTAKLKANLMNKANLLHALVNDDAGNLSTNVYFVPQDVSLSSENVEALVIPDLDIDKIPGLQDCLNRHLEISAPAPRGETAFFDKKLPVSEGATSAQVTQEHVSENSSSDDDASLRPK